jgi:hypothetical protein
MRYFEVFMEILAILNILMAAPEVNPKGRDSLQVGDIPSQLGTVYLCTQFQRKKRKTEIEWEDSLQASANPSFSQSAVQTINKCIERKRQFTNSEFFTKFLIIRIQFFLNSIQLQSEVLQRNKRKKEVEWERAYLDARLVGAEGDRHYLLSPQRRNGELLRLIATKSEIRDVL